MSSLSRVGGHFHTLNDSRQFHNHNSAFRPFPSRGGMSSRLNTLDSVNMHGFPTHSTNDHLNFQPVKAHANLNHVQRMPISSAASQHPTVFLLFTWKKVQWHLVKHYAIT